MIEDVELGLSCWQFLDEYNDRVFIWINLKKFGIILCNLINERVKFQVDWIVKNDSKK